MRSVVRVWLLTQQGLRETAHLKLAWVLVVTACGLTVGAALLREFNFGTEEARFLHDLSDGALMLFGMILAIALPVALLGVRSVRHAAGLSLMHGARRHEWLLARTLASWLSLGALTFMVQGLVALLLWRYGHNVSVATLATDGERSMLRLLVVAGLAVMMTSVCESPLLAAVLTLGMTIAAQLTPAIAWAEQRAVGLARLVWRGLDWALPDFYAVGISKPQLAYTGAYAALCLVISCWAFSRREL